MIPINERLIVALDLPDSDSALSFAKSLDIVTVFKIGLELAMGGTYFELLSDLRATGKKVFADIKFFDIPETVGRSVANLAKHEPEFITVHSGSSSVLKAANANKGNAKILAVTVLTSITRADGYFEGFQSDWQLQDEVVHRARMAANAGCDGVVASPLEARILRQELGRDLLIVCPGIRSKQNIDSNDIQDQKRVATVENAFEAGADYIVVGRPIRDAESPKLAAIDFQSQIRSWFG